MSVDERGNDMKCCTARLMAGVLILRTPWLHAVLVFVRAARAAI